MKDEKIDAIFNPKSVALIGGSNKEGKMGYVFAKNITSGYEGKIYMVNPSEEQVFGLKSYPDVKSIPDEIDLAVIVIPAKAVPSVMEELSAKHAKSAVVITAGFGEAGPEGKRCEEELMKAANKGGVKVVGPNCFGIYNCNIGLNASLGVGTPPKGGDISFVTQSGAYGMAILTFALDHHMRFAKVMAHGNKAGIDDHEVIRYLGEDEETKVICLFLESVDKGREFFEEARRIALSKPIIATKTGRTAGAARAAASHTAAMAGTFTAYEAAFKQSGVIFARNGMDLVNIAKGLDWQPLPKGNRVGIITNSGGTGVELADLCEEGGLVVPELSENVQKKIRELIPAYASARNPIDMTPIWPKFVDLYSKCIQILYESSEVDIIVPIILQRAAMMPEVCTAVADTVNDCLTRGIRKPTYVCWVSVRDALKNMDLLQSKHVPCFDWPERTARAVAAISGYAEFLKRRDVSLESR
ncbi:MAG: CoA-binding protein [Methanomassiliicoccales archaeon]|nr:CoA-binding protein [Methanomassiliicoccales archaeon]